MPTPAQDKLALMISALALAVSIVTPIATYMWLDPNIKKEKDERLILLSQDTSELWTTAHPPVKQDDGTENWEHGIEQLVPRLRLQLKNTGPLTVKGVVIAFQPALPRDVDIKLLPPLPYQREDKSDVTRFSLSAPIGAGELLEVRIHGLPLKRPFRKMPPGEQRDSYNLCSVFGDPCTGPTLIWVTSETRTIAAQESPSPE
jgi:hypothetical protein